MVSTVLHVGCGPQHELALHPFFRTENWREVRLDLDPNVKPDIVSSITDMSLVASQSVDAVYSAHNLEHLYATEVPAALAEFNRVLAPGGVALLIVPDLQSVAALVAEDKLDEAAYVSPMGPIAPLDIIYGLRSALAQTRASQLERSRRHSWPPASRGEAFNGILAGSLCGLWRSRPRRIRLRL